MSKPRPPDIADGLCSRANERPRLGLRTRITHVRVFGESAQDFHSQVVTASHLAGEPHVRRNLIECGELVTLGISHRAWIAIQNLHSARRAPRIAAATMQDIDPRVHDGQYQSLTLLRAGPSNSLHLDHRHESLTSPIPNHLVDPTSGDPTLTTRFSCQVCPIRRGTGDRQLTGVGSARRTPPHAARPTPPIRYGRGATTQSRTRRRSLLR